ncbi:hypothetical protein [Stappia sp. ES.058]|uniref:hypothetical protein n=1 Tax=Stappia sp. ES.058 TaxID=1881061 RepID=UPI00087A2676|nr:hypothetical protein [Stappia sp. ES.058]SDU07531.1 hypothetical protein SAMN05428979_1484 [Stappia sp. ES.058]
MTFTTENFKTAPDRTYREFVLAAVAAVAVFAAIATVAQTIKVASASDAQPAEIAAKSDRVTSALPMSCQGQAWGDWTSECLSAIGGSSNPRQVKFKTFESRDAQGRTSILARVPARS